jgi:hypothetical protein
MNPFAIDLNDRALSLARGGRVLSSSPAAVFDGSTAEVVGTGAWRSLRSQPTATSSRHLEAVLTQSHAPERAFQLFSADLARRLEVHRPQPDEPLWIAAPAFAEPHGLGAVLGILRELSLPVGGFIDSATVTVAALANGRDAIVLELGLHRVAATFVDVGSGIARRRRSVFGQPGGLIELYQSLLERVSGAMVRRTRFDPRQDAATEQQLFDLIPTLVSQATAIATLRRGSEDAVEVELSRDELAEGARGLNRETLRLIHELRPAGMPVALVMPTLLSNVPGLRDEIEQFVGCDLIGCPDGFAAAAISATEHPETISQDAPVHLLRRAPLHELTGQMATTRERLGGRKEAGPAPTHVLLDGRALSIGSDSAVVGRSPGAERAVLLPDGLAGVSRRHCTLVRDGSELVLLDHSTFGTFVNGERVAERVRVYAGDRIRIGEPGVELALIAVGETASGAP